MSLVRETDYGTPASKAAETVTLTIDGMQMTVPAGTTIMRAAALAGNTDPKTLRDRHDEGVRLLPALPRRDRRPQRHARLLHHARRRRRLW